MASIDCSKEQCERMSIAEVRRTYPDHWILLNEIEVSPETSEVVSGQFITAEREKDRLYEAAMFLRDGWALRNAYVTCTKTPPPGVEFIL